MVEDVAEFMPEWVLPAPPQVFIDHPTTPTKGFRVLWLSLFCRLCLAAAHRMPRPLRAHKIVLCKGW